MFEWLEIAVALLVLQPISGQDDGFSSQMTHWLWQYSWHVTSDSEVTFVIICSFVSYSWLWASWPNIYNSLTTNSIYTAAELSARLTVFAAVVYSWCCRLGDTSHTIRWWHLSIAANCNPTIVGLKIVAARKQSPIRASPLMSSSRCYHLHRVNLDLNALSSSMK